MPFNFSNAIRTSARKAESKTNSAATGLDRLNAPKGFAQVLKGAPNESSDRCVKAFQGNSAFATRLGGLKPW